MCRFLVLVKNSDFRLFKILTLHNACVLRNVLGVLRNVPGVLRNVTGVLCNILGVLRNAPGVLRNVTGVLRNVTGMLCDVITSKHRVYIEYRVHGLRRRGR